MKVKHAELAKKMAERSSYKFRVGCVIVRGSRVVGFGWNDGVKTHAKSPHPFKSVHAEFDAVMSTKGESITGCDVYVCRLLANGSLAMAKPCEHCEAMLRKLGIRRVFFSIADEWQQIDYD
jgi:deoxycytidylate deaminase